MTENQGQTHLTARMANNETIYRKSKILPVHSVNRTEGQCQEGDRNVKPGIRWKTRQLALRQRPRLQRFGRARRHDAGGKGW